MGTRFSVPVQTGPEFRPFCTVGTRSFPGIKRPERGADHPPPSNTEVADGLELYLRLPSVPVYARDGVTFTFICNCLRYGMV
jgi:hypothetical protein